MPPITSPVGGGAGGYRCGKKEREMRAVIFSALFSLLLPCSVRAADNSTGNDLYSGNDLYQLCRNKATDPLCAMWVTGFLNGIVAANDTRLPAACPPPKVTGAQARLIIDNFMQEHPDSLHITVRDVADAALAAAFPCKGSN